MELGFDQEMIEATLEKSWENPVSKLIVDPRFRKLECLGRGNSQ